MTCRSVQAQLSAYLDRELSGDEMLTIRTHLSDCSTCREEMEELRMLKRMLCSAPAPEPPADLADRLCAAVLSQDRARLLRDEEKPREERSTFRVAFLTFGGVAFASMALTFLLFNNVRPEEPNRGRPTAQNTRDLSVDVQRDQMYSIGMDATGGVPMFTSAQDVRP